MLNANINQRETFISVTSFETHASSNNEFYLCLQHVSLVQIPQLKAILSGGSSQSIMHFLLSGCIVAAIWKNRHRKWKPNVKLKDDTKIGLTVVLFMFFFLNLVLSRHSV